MAVAVAEAANHRMNAASQQPGYAAPNLPCTPRLLPAAEYGDRRYTASGRCANSVVVMMPLQAYFTSSALIKSCFVLAPENLCMQNIKLKVVQRLGT